MARYALLPTPGDPAIVTFWKKFYDEVWGDLFDGLLVCYNPPPEIAGYADYIADLFADATVVQVNGMIDHGPALGKLVRHDRIKPGDMVAFLEDDSIIFKRDRLIKCLDLIESGTVEIVGSPRGSAALSLIAEEDHRFGPVQVGPDTGPNFWPNLFITHKSLLLKTDLNFAGVVWEAGVPIRELGDWTPGQQIKGDTMVWMSIQLRALTDRVHWVSQYHSSPHDLQHAKANAGIWAGECQWFHMGSLSSLRLGNDLANVQVNTDMEQLEWERRLMYVWLAAEETGWEGEYIDWIMRGVNQLGLNVERMKLWMYAYRQRLDL